MGPNDTTRETTKVAGERAEARAERHLRAQGMTILARNYRCRGGEIDLVCRDRLTLVFVEVRSRRSAAFGGAAASITAHKRARIVFAAQHYLLAHSSERVDCRFDCVLIEGAALDRIEWLRDAFAAV
jgi:putative endonuclease